MKNIDELVVDKLCDIINYVLAKVIKPDIEIEKVRELDEEKIAKLKKQYGVEGIILDVDETIRKNMNKIPKCNQEWIEKIKGQLKVIIVSNGRDKGVEQFLKEKGIDYICLANKPLKKNFIQACKKMGLEPDKVMVIGDNLLCDIYGGKRNNMKTGLVKTVECEDEEYARV